jgi:UrcA family protein
MSRQRNLLPASVLALTCAAGLLTLGAPALAADPVSELTITSQSQAGGQLSLSTPVAYRDLDLTTGSGRRELHRRVLHAAQDVCRRVDENNLLSGPAFVCQDDAMKSALPYESAAIHRAMDAQTVPRTYAAVPLMSENGR